MLDAWNGESLGNKLVTYRVSFSLCLQHTKCLDILGESQARICRLFDHDAAIPATAVAIVRARVNVPVTQKRPQAKATSRLAAANPFNGQPQVLQEWISLLDFPVPLSSSTATQENDDDLTRGTKNARIAGLSQTLKNVMLGRLVAAWISLSGASAAAKNADVSTSRLSLSY